MTFKYYKYTIAFCLILIFSVPALCLAERIVSVKKDNVNVRTGPGTNFPVYMEVFKGYPLKVLQEKDEWLQVSDFENDKGWIYSKLVTPGTTVIVNGKKAVNMRTTPSTKATVVASVDRGVILTKLATEGKWIKVQHSQGTIGWIYAPLLWP